MIPVSKFYVGFCVGLWILLFFSCDRNRRTSTRFTAVPSSHSNVTFTNTLNYSDDFNIIEYLYFYNGGGVAIGDINNDHLPDLYFSSNQGDNRLYLNKGDFVFQDITNGSGVEGAGNWKTGVTMADVNGDGWLDIFVCGVGNYKNFDGRNQLLINNGDLTFSDQTAAYGLNFQGFSTQATFFDYDNDGDLDMYLLNHSVHTARSYGDTTLRIQDDPLAGDRLYENQLIPHGTNFFKDVTSRSGIYSSQIGYGLAVGCSDVNGDGYMDLYVSNDFHENDYLYINNGNGTFRQQIEKAMPHTSRFSMGNDIADVNNDGWADIVTLDMLPKDEAVIKTSAGEDPYEIFQYKLRFGYHYQFARNALQLNRGTSATKLPVFSDIAPLAGIEATDWSWSALIADFDNDGFKDIFITNGIERRPNDMDYISFINDRNVATMEDEMLIEQMPFGKTSNVMYRNDGDLTFSDVSTEWIGDRQSLSNGASYADLDGDGDLDIVVNNINEEAFLLRNDSDKSRNFLQVRLKGGKANRTGIGAKVVVWAGGKQLFFEQSTSRGWLSSVDPLITIGLGDATRIDSLAVIWPGNKLQTQYGIDVNQTVELNEGEANDVFTSGRNQELFFQSEELPSFHKENDYSSFNKEILMPHMLTTQGPKLAVGDINGDGMEDFFVGGASGQAGVIYHQKVNGDFEITSQPALQRDAEAEDVGCEFVDVDGDNDLDLVVVSGGQQNPNTTLQPRLYLNDGRGLLVRSEGAFGDISVNASCVKSADIDGDGDRDLFIGGRVIPGAYGIDPPSFLLLNNGTGLFEDVTLKAFGTSTLGMVTDAVWTKVNEDARPDLVLVGEWMPITIFIQKGDLSFSDETASYGLADTNGWWNCLVECDIDDDGDSDFLAGNLGLNSRLRASKSEPVSLYVQDLDGNGSLDPILTYYNNGISYPFVSRDQLVKQAPSYKKSYLKYNNYRNVGIDDILSVAPEGSGSKKDAFVFSSALITRNNDGSGFTVDTLPVEAQMYPVFSFLVDDVNEDGKKDILAVGNWYAIQPEFGRYDSGYGSLLWGKGQNRFSTDSFLSSGFQVMGEGRDICRIITPSGKVSFVVARNNNSPILFRKKDN